MRPCSSRSSKVGRLAGEAAFAVRQRHGHRRAGRETRGERATLRLPIGHDLDELRLEVVRGQVVRDRHASEHAALRDDLRAVAQPEHELAALRFFLYHRDDLALGRDGAGAHAILVREPAGDHVAVEVAQGVWILRPPEQARVDAGVAARIDRLGLGVRAGEDDDGDAWLRHRASSAAPTTRPARRRAVRHRRRRR